MAVVPVASGSRRVAAQGWTVAALVLTAVVFAALARGAYEGPARAIVLVLVAVTCLVAGTDVAAIHTARVPLLGGLAIATSAVLSGFAAGADTGALPTVLLIAALVGTVVVVASAADDTVEQLLSGVALAGVVVAAVGCYGVATHRFPLAIESQGLWRAASSITYANATGALLTLVALVVAGRAVSRRSIGDVLVLTTTLIGLGATLCRGAFVALAIGLVVLASLAGPARTIRTVAPALLGALVGVGALLPSIASTPRPVLAAAGIVGGLLVAVATTRLPVAIVVAAFAAAGIVVIGSPAFDRIDDTRATASSSDRFDQWHAAWRVAASSPVVGVGPKVDLTYVASDGRGLVRATWAHNEYLQLAAEQGAIGVGALAAGGAATGIVVVRRRSLRTAGPIAALVAFAVHSASDFLWHVPVLPLTAAVLLGLAIARPVEERS